MSIAITADGRRPTRSANSARRRDLVVYWITTGLVGLVMVFSVVSFVFHDRFPFPNGKEGAFVHLRLPGYLKVELTIAKVLGLPALLLPRVPARIKDFAYFGFGITLVSASVAHFAVGDARLSVLYLVDPLIFLALLIVSYTRFHGLLGREGAPFRG